MIPKSGRGIDEAKELPGALHDDAHLSSKIEACLFNARRQELNINQVKSIGIEPGANLVRFVLIKPAGTDQGFYILPVPVNQHLFTG